MKVGRGLAGGFITANGPLITSPGPSPSARSVRQRNLPERRRREGHQQRPVRCIEQTRSEFAKTTEERSRQVFVDKGRSTSVNEAAQAWPTSLKWPPRIATRSRGSTSCSRSTPPAGSATRVHQHDFPRRNRGTPRPVRCRLSDSTCTPLATSATRRRCASSRRFDELARRGRRVDAERQGEVHFQWPRKRPPPARSLPDELAGILSRFRAPRRPDEAEHQPQRSGGALGVTESWRRPLPIKMQRLVDMIDKPSNAPGARTREKLAGYSRVRSRVAKAFAEAVRASANTEGRTPQRRRDKAQVEASEKLAGDAGSPSIRPASSRR